MSDDYGEMVKLNKYKYKLHSKGDRFRDKKDKTIWKITGINTDLNRKIARNNYENDINIFVNYTLQNEKGEEIYVDHGVLTDKKHYNQFMFDDIRSLFSRGGNRKSRKPKKSKKNNKKRRATRRK